MLLQKGLKRQHKKGDIMFRLSDYCYENWHIYYNKYAQAVSALNKLSLKARPSCFLEISCNDKNWYLLK